MQERRSTSISVRRSFGLYLVDRDLLFADVSEYSAGG